MFELFIIYLKNSVFLQTVFIWLRSGLGAFFKYVVNYKSSNLVYIELTEVSYLENEKHEAVNFFILQNQIKIFH